MNVYDFDKTIFYPDSMILFARYSIRRHPSLIIRYLPNIIKAAICYSLRKCSVLVVHEALNCIIKYLKNPEKDIALFWKKYEKNISKWYLSQKKSDDLIISASPEYLLIPIIKKLEVNLIGTIVDSKTGKMVGNIRIAKAKADYIIRQNMPIIDNFYSDSLSDMPIALLAEKAFIVKDKAQRPEPWPHINTQLLKDVNKKINY